MFISLKIAFRNIVADRKRALLIGTAIFISLLILFLTNSSMNGIEKQVLRSYINLQSGDVAVMWKDLYNVSGMDAGKFLGDSATFDIKKDSTNKKAIERLKLFLDENKSEVKAYYPTIRRNATVQTASSSGKKKESTILVYSLKSDSKEQLLSTSTLKMSVGELLSSKASSICISKEVADENNLKIGDKVEINATKISNEMNTMSFVVRGIYDNAAGYDNLYGFIEENKARELFGIDQDYFDIVRIYLKNDGNITGFSDKLDKYLLGNSDVLRAQSFSQASAFYTSTSKNIKIFFEIFNIFLLIMIGIGLRSTLRIKIFERMREFGTLRAVGYSRFKCFSIIFLEVLLLSLIALMGAVAFAAIFVSIFGRVGIYVGSGGVTYALGGESFYPELGINDIIFAFLVISMFSLVSTFGPGLKLCYQKITDILMKRQKKIYVFAEIIKSLGK